MSKRILTNKLFRQQAIDEQKDRLHGEVVLSQPASVVLITMVTFLMVACIVILLIAGSYSRRMPVDGYLSVDTKHLQAELFVPARSAGLISSGQQVQIRYQAYPYQHYGLQQGIVKTVSNLVLSPKQLPIPVNISEPVYRVIIDIDQQFITAFGKQFPLQAGMLINADIVLEPRPLAQLLLKPLGGLSGKL